MLKRISILLIALSIIACSKKDKLNYTKSTVNGVEIITNENRPADSSFKMDLKLVAEIHSDAVNGDSCANFRELYKGGVDFDTQNNIFVMDDKSCRILKYDSHGQFIKSFGNKGQGPGEFDGGSFAIFNDTVFVASSRNLQQLTFDKNGNYLKSKKFNNNSELPAYYNGLNLYFIKALMRMKMADNKMSGEESIVAFSVSDCKNKIFSTKKIDFEAKKPLVTNTPCSASDDGKFYVTEPSDSKYTVHVYDMKGDKISTINKRFIKAKTSYESQGKINTDFYDAINQLLTDKQNRLWVRTYKNYNKNIFDVFAQGVFQNTIVLPLDSTFTVFFRKDKLIAYKDNYTNIKIYDYK